ncbi:alpha/beta-hydrolase [Aulographum hederae CBS 113979]|uniref:Alpha/beta-hydrolase n=1 Tax=Aulographum hederae CBS 113979 TaxID=1176131 RepID=A0A6G1GUY3_9PEZI|nr:alpha/beta-hydrolase [Aulographum hederae CBS 113979]
MAAPSPTTTQDKKQITKKETINVLKLIPVFLDIVLATDRRLLTSPFRGDKGAPTYRRDVTYCTMRHILSGFSVIEGQYLTPSTAKAYKSVCRSWQWKADIVDLGGGAKGNWIGRRDAKVMMLYFHGGGYIAAATPGHVKFQFRLQYDMVKAGHSFSILSMEYTLAPYATYPGQLGQAVAALRYLIEVEKKDPANIIVGGDSAGGNLCSALLLHLGHPHPSSASKPVLTEAPPETVPTGTTPETSDVKADNPVSPSVAVPALKLNSPLRAALLISPWVDFDTTRPSLKHNAKSDYLTATALDRASGAFGAIATGGKHDEYSEPVKAPVEWWADVSKVVKEVLVWGGGGEVLIDGIEEFGARMKEGFDRADGIEMVVGKGKVGGKDERSEEEKEGRNGGVRDKPSGMDSPTLPVTTEDTPTPLNSTTTNGTTYSTANGSIEKTPTTPDVETPTALAHTETRTKDFGADPEEKSRVKVVVTPREGHEEMIINNVVRISKKGQGGKEVDKWLNVVLGRRT